MSNSGRLPILVTGAAGFIGFHLCLHLLQQGELVVGVDNLNAYYDVRLKTDRLDILLATRGFSFERLDIGNVKGVSELFARCRFGSVVNLAAQAGVRYSITNPRAYIESNLVGFANILEACRHHEIAHLVYASSSSVYGANKKMPFSVEDNVDHPVSLYAATKKANELMAHSYAHLYGIPCTGLRFFTVYGPWGRPDMALFKFAASIIAGKPIQLFNYGNMQRDFTYVDDIVEGVARVLRKPPAKGLDSTRADPKAGDSDAPYRIYNIGNHSPVELLTVVRELELAIGKRALTELLPMQPGDVQATYADVQGLVEDIGFRPDTPLRHGIEQFVTWYREYYGGETQDTPPRTLVQAL